MKETKRKTRKGHEIPITSQSEFIRDVAKVVKKATPKPPNRPKKKA